MTDLDGFQTDPGAFAFHASIDGRKLEYLSPDHPVPLGDWGDGAYLSDDAELSKIWGASADTVPYYESALNMYYLDDGIYDCNGYIINPDCYEDIIRWACSVAVTREIRISDHYANDINVDTNQVIANINHLYDKYDVNGLLEHDWIISRRSDDGLWRFIVDFFADNLSIEGLRQVYTDCSFGDQLVLKTSNATQHLHFLECDFYVVRDYVGKYQELSNSHTRSYQAIRTANPPFGNLSCEDYL